MAARKRIRPRRPPAGGAAKQEAQRQGGAGRRRRTEAELMTEALSFAQVSAVTGIDKYRIGDVVKRAGVPVYRSPADARKKFIRHEDLERLTGLVPDAGDTDTGGASPEAAQ